MPELIERNEAIRKIQDEFCAECNGYPCAAMCRGCEYLYCMDILEQVPESIAETVQRGYIIDPPANSKELSKCSVCGAEILQLFTAYCGNCGANLVEEVARDAAD